MPAFADDASWPADLDDARPLVREIERTLNAIGSALTAPSPARKPTGASGKETPNKLFLPDALTNPEYKQFALKLTLATMICYFTFKLANWPGIQTCIITCIIVSTETIGQSVEKMMLRIGGCLVGAAIGFGVILFLMPVLDDLGSLLLVIAPVIFLSGWIRNGSERLAYGGQQIAFAFFVCVLQGFGPGIDMTSGRDRILGILLGDVVVYLVYTTLWPVSVADKVRRGVASALGHLADLLSLSSEQLGGAGGKEEELRQKFSGDIARVRSLIVIDRYEPHRVRPDRGRRSIDAEVVTAVQAMIMPISVILAQRTQASQHGWTSDNGMSSHEASAEDDRIADWLRRLANWITTGSPNADLAFPAADARGGRSGAGRSNIAAWQKILRDDIADIIWVIGPRAAVSAEAPNRAVVLAS